MPAAARWPLTWCKIKLAWAWEWRGYAIAPLIYYQHRHRHTDTYIHGYIQPGVAAKSTQWSKWREETIQNTTVTQSAACATICKNFITGQNEREETTQNTIVTKSAACASYKSNYVTYITATYTTVTVTVTDNLLQHELQKSLHPSPVVSRLLSRPV